MNKIISFNSKNKRNVAETIALIFENKNGVEENKNGVEKYIRLKLLDGLLWITTENDDKGLKKKYIGQPFWSKAALNQLKLNITNKNSKVLGLRHEHLVPKKFICNLIIKEVDKSVENIYKILDDLGHAVIITKDEDEIINKKELRSKMPDGFDYPVNYDVFARYNETKIEVCDVTCIDMKEIINVDIGELNVINKP